MFAARSTRRRSKRKSRRRYELHKANGVLHPRVQAVGPEHFGVVCFDCAKARSKWILCDFYGKVLVEPETVEHQRGQLALTIARLCDCAKRHDLKDLVISIERTGTYHLPVKRAFESARFLDRPFDVRIVHPFATKQHRQAANPGDKTDDNDLAALFRATVAGFGLREPVQDSEHEQLRLLARHRRDWVNKRTIVCCQLREHLEAVLPGYAALFGGKLWDSDVALPLACHLASPEAFQREGVAGMARRLRAVLMMIADNLVTCNAHYRGLATLWTAQGRDPRSIRARVATRFARLVFQLVSGRQILRHPGMRGRDAIVHKLMRFHLGHGAPMTALFGTLQDAIKQLPAGCQAHEAAPLAAELTKVQTSRRGPQPLGEILPLVLARLGAGGLQSQMAREPN